MTGASHHVPVQPAATCGQKERAFDTLADGQVDRRAVRGASGIVTTLPPLRRGWAR
jgi:hypothetical protein